MPSESQYRVVNMLSLLIAKLLYNGTKVSIIQFESCDMNKIHKVK